MPTTTINNMPINNTVKSRVAAKGRHLKVMLSTDGKNCRPPISVARWKAKAANHRNPSTAPAY